jgi:arylsulfatase I/J
VHVNTENAGVSTYNPKDPVSGYAGVPRNMTCIASKLSEVGYATHFVGKWDAGMATPRHTPRGRGYDSWYGYYQHSNDYWTKGMGVGQTGLETTGEIDCCLNHFVDFSEANATYFGGVRDAAALSGACANSSAADPPCYEDHLLKARTLRIIDAHDASKPLFLVHAFHSVHTPLQAPRAYLARVAALAAPFVFDDLNRQRYHAMVLYMDDAVGEFVAALRRKQLWEETLFAFMSDNGGPVYQPGAANNHPLKGGKFSDWEGAARR